MLYVYSNVCGGKIDMFSRQWCILFHFISKSYTYTCLYNLYIICMYSIIYSLLHYVYCIEKICRKHRKKLAGTALEGDGWERGNMSWKHLLNPGRGLTLYTENNQLFCKLNISFLGIFNQNCSKFRRNSTPNTETKKWSIRSWLCILYIYDQSVYILLFLWNGIWDVSYCTYIAAAYSTVSFFYGRNKLDFGIFVCRYCAHLHG